uniref:Uncharacterized protein n=1 Tax=Physcomitrium patens TaxID=3218 RepID=A0A2K1JQ69_PHYPA|nr:hypothetical protein PHYPA_016062 [Physcomitrium patens]
MQFLSFLWHLNSILQIYMSEWVSRRKLSQMECLLSLMRINVLSSMLLTERIGLHS